MYTQTQRTSVLLYINTRTHAHKHIHIQSVIYIYINALTKPFQGNAESREWLLLLSRALAPVERWCTTASPPPLLHYYTPFALITQKPRIYIYLWLAVTLYHSWWLIERTMLGVFDSRRDKLFLSLSLSVLLRGRAQQCDAKTEARLSRYSSLFASIKLAHTQTTTSRAVGRALPASAHV